MRDRREAARRLPQDQDALGIDLPRIGIEAYPGIGRSSADHRITARDGGRA